MCETEQIMYQQKQNIFTCEVLYLLYYLLYKHIKVLNLDINLTHAE